MLTRDQKTAIVAGLREKIEASRALFLTNLIGVPSNEANLIRKNVRDAKGTIVITRNTLLQKAAEGTPAQEMLSGLKGPQAVAFAFEDAPPVAKALYDAGEENEIVSLTHGLLNGSPLDKSEIIALAKLPSKDVMLATVLATMNAPVSSFVRVLDAIREQKNEGGGEAAVAAAPAEEKTEE